MIEENENEGENMIVLHRKRLTTVAFLILVVVFSSLLAVNKSSKTVETVSLPVSNKVIVIDAGHGVPDERSTK